MSQTLRFLAVLELLGLAGLPLAARAFGRLPGGGAGLGRVLALLILGWLVWLAGSLGVPNGLGLVLAGAVVVAGMAVAAWRLGPAPAPDPFRRRLVVVAEILFAVSFLAAALYASFSPDVWGTEKPMDMALVNTTLTSRDFPPQDPWMSGEQLNYYYLGQLLLGLLVRLTGVEPTAGYNLALATVLALTVTAAFGVAAAVAEAARRQRLPVASPFAAGAAAVVLLVVMGNLRGGWSAVTRSGPLADFDWFAASRVIPDTINEFPFFSLTVGDVHAHFIAVPLTLLALAFAAQAGIHGPPPAAWRNRWWETAGAALSVGILYAVNSWSWPVTAGLLVLAVLVWATSAEAQGRRREALAWGAGVLALGILMVVPFIVDFDPNARGFGWVPASAREPLARFAGHNLVIFGALAWLLVAPFAARAAAARHPVRVAIWGLAVVIVVLPLATGSRLAGAAVVALLAAVALHAALAARGPTTVRLVWALAAAGLACIAGPEAAYVRDEFDGGRFVRMNTVFKLGYQAWILLALAGALSLALSRHWLPRGPRLAWEGMALVLVLVGLAYVPVATAGRKDGFADGPRLDGRAWLARTAPGDVAAIDWLRRNAAGDAVVLEAVGEDYSPFGNARVSTYSGRPTVLGWQGHELQWGHRLGSRRADVQTLYQTPDAATARALLARYGVDYAVVGPLERTTYGDPGALARLGRKVFDRRGTAVYAYAPRTSG